MFARVAGHLALVLTFVAFWPYLRSIAKGETRPHYFSWVVWSLTTSIAFFAQWSEGGGYGAVSTGLSGALTALVAFLAFVRRGEGTVTRLDWAFFVGALVSLPLWFFSRSALGAVIVLTVVDLLGFGPTLRKARENPFEEDLGFYWMMAARSALSVVALERYSLATVLFPAAIALACVALCVVVLGSRRRPGVTRRP